MQTNEVLKVVKSIRNGAYFKAQWESELPLTAEAKKKGITATKTCAAVCRKGITYAKQGTVKEKLLAGHHLTGELPWGKWKEGYEGLLIEHKDCDYIRLYLGGHQIKTSYQLNGKEMSKSELQSTGYIQPSWFTKPSEKPDCVTLKVSNLKKIGRRKEYV